MPATPHRPAAPALLHPVLCLAALLLGLLLASCASAPPPDPRTLLHDEWFAAAPTPDVDPFALSEDMRQFAEREFSFATTRDPRRALIAALYSRGLLRLEYDSSRTRTAAEAFDARAGNCLSLVVMTAAFARHLGLPVSFQSLKVEESYSRRGGLFLASGHVNLVLDRPRARGLHRRTYDDGALTVDFLPPGELTGISAQPLQERTIVAMYLNNRAAELLGEGRIDAAYGWARQAVLQDPGFLPSTNTLAVVYSRAGHGDAAERLLRQVLAREPDNVAALTNLVGLLVRVGRTAEGQALAERLARLQPLPPFHDFDLGRKALAEGDARRALEHFARELARQPGQEDVHLWAAQAWWQLGDTEQAARHLRQAMDHSGTPASQQRYAAKLDRLRNGSLR